MPALAQESVLTFGWALRCSKDYDNLPAKNRFGTQLALDLWTEEVFAGSSSEQAACLGARVATSGTWLWHSAGAPAAPGARRNLRVEGRNGQHGVQIA